MLSKISNVIHRRKPEPVKPNSLTETDVHKICRAIDPLKLCQAIQNQLTEKFVESQQGVFHPTNVLPAAQQDLVGDRIADIVVNGRPIIEETSPDTVKVAGIFLSYEKANGAKVSKPNLNVTRQNPPIDPETGVQGRYTCTITDYDLPSGATDVRINGYLIPNCSSNADIEGFLTDNFNQVLGRALALRILNGLLPASQAFDCADKIFYILCMQDGLAGNAFLNRMQLLHQSIANAGTQMMNKMFQGIAQTDPIVTCESYSLNIEASCRRETVQGIDFSSARQLIDAICSGQITVNCQARLLCLPELKFGVERFQLATLKYRVSIEADGHLTVDPRPQHFEICEPWTTI